MRLRTLSSNDGRRSHATGLHPVTPRLVWPVAAELGEGPVWLDDEQALAFVDIKGGKVHFYTPATQAKLSVTLGGRPSFVLPFATGGLCVGNLDGLHILEGDELSDAFISVPMPDHNRTNDATVDSAGRLWFGTMDDEELRPTGAVYSLDRGELIHHGGDAVVTNGPAIDADASTLYRVDSGERTIWRHPILPDGRLGDAGPPFLRFEEADGYPDGIAVDEEHCLWVAMWDGWAVRRFSPKGELLAVVDFPCARVTKIAFGGPDRRIAFATTARTGLSARQLEEQPLAGGLFAFDAGVAGPRTHAIHLV